MLPLSWPIIITFTLLFFLSACNKNHTPQQQSKNSPADLAAHSQEFRKEVIKVTEGVYVAVGYGLANSILLEGDDGLVIVDTMESLEEGRTVLQAFRKISKKPIKALIYTHNHTDHVMGAAAFAEVDEIPVYAHASTQHYIDRVINVIRPIINVRSARMFGTHLQGHDLENAGIGPFLGVQDDSVIYPLRPTHTFDDELKLSIAGIQFELYHAPGETNDQLFVWLPEKKVLLCGDNFYRSFPNLYTIRGTSYRDVTAWVNSLDKMRALKPSHLVPSHTRPLQGDDFILDTLTDYRDAIQFVHDQSIRGMNLGMTPDELVEFVQLPAHLAASPFLQEFYGRVSWSVRAIFDGYLGWFDGNPSQLQLLGPLQQAQHMAELAGGETALLASAAKAVEQQQFQWALQLTDYLLRLQPQLEQARQLRIQALRALGEQEANPNARHYYLTQARELREGLHPAIKIQPDIRFLHDIPVESIFRSMAVSLVAEKTLLMEQSVNFTFPDLNRHYSLTIRRGVTEIRQDLVTDAAIHITTDSHVWKEIVARIRNPISTLASGELQIVGSKFELVSFLGLFQSPDR